MKGVIVAKQDFNIASDSKDQYVNTRTPLFKLFMSDKGERFYSSRNLQASPDSFIIPHNLGYIPMYFLFCDRAAQSIRKLVISQDSVFADTSVLVTCVVDKINIYVNISSAFASPVSGTFGYNYFIFYDKVG